MISASNEPAPSPETPPDHEAARLSILAADIRILFGKLKRRLRAEADQGDLTPSQLAVLLCLERDGPATVTTLARAEGVRPQSMGATVAVLEAAGLINGAPDPGDGRQTILSLTPACLEMIRAGRAARQDWLFRAMQAKLAPQERRLVEEAVALLGRLVDS